MATNWTIQTSSKASTTDNFAVEILTKTSHKWDNQYSLWNNISNIWDSIGETVTWTIANGATTRDSD
tara:strand:- start:57 stop:257 length:201 start_codon:yes stop_codon:yes gene_type:complete